MLRVIRHQIKKNIICSLNPQVPRLSMQPFTSWINHSCKPNAVGGAGVTVCSDEHVHAMSDIKKDEVVLVTYLDTHTKKLDKAGTK
jgi:hypothetical protein